MRSLVATLTISILAGCQGETAVSLRTETDTWYQAPNNQVDILWVIDNSTSMTEEQDTLARGFASFTGQMEASGTDFHIGVISTSFDYADTTRGVLIGDPPYLTNADDYEEEFKIRAQMGIGGSDKEKGLEASAWALSPTMTTGPNAGFLRTDAQLLVVVVSDEEDCSDEGALEGQPANACYLQDEKLVPVYEYVAFFQGLKATPDMVQVGAIVGVQDGACEDAFPSDRYALVAGLTGGLLGDICLSDWSSMLTELGLTATGVRNAFQLTHGAVVETLVVMVDGVEVPQSATTWTYSPDTWFVTFAPEAVPERGAEITAEYTVDPQSPEPAGF